MPEIGIGFGPSVSAAAGSNVNVPNAPQLQLGFTGGDQIGPVGYRGSGTVTVPLNDPSLQNTNVGGTVGFNLPGVSTTVPGTSIPLTNLRLSGNYSPAAGPTGGVQYSGTNQLFDATDQVKLAIRVPIPLPDLTQTTPPDSNGVSDVITPTGPEGPPAMSATRNVSNLGYPDGQGNTVTLNPDGSYTVHTPTGDVTNFGPNYLSQNGLDQSQGGTLTHQLIDTLGQRTDQLTWKGTDGSTITQTPSGTLTQTNQDGSTVQQSSSGVVTQTNPDGSTMSYNPSTGAITTSDCHWFGTTTTYNQDGSVTQMSPAGTTMWTRRGMARRSSTQATDSDSRCRRPIRSQPHHPSRPRSPCRTTRTPPRRRPTASRATTTNSRATRTTAAPSWRARRLIRREPTTPPRRRRPRRHRHRQTPPRRQPTRPPRRPAPPTPQAPVDTTPAPAPIDTTPAPAPVDTTPAPAPIDARSAGRPRATDRHHSRADRHHPSADRHHPGADRHDASTVGIHPSTDRHDPRTDRHDSGSLDTSRARRTAAGSTPGPCGGDAGGGDGGGAH